MQNSVKRPSEDIALQITKPARKAQLVDEDSEDNPIRMSEVYIYGFDNLLLLFDCERVPTEVRAELVASAARDSKSVYHGARASVTQSGNGYQIPLSGGEQAGFTVGETVTMSTADGVIALYKNSETARLAKDIITQARDLLG